MLSSATIKKPIKFTYSQATVKSDPHKSNVSKQSETKLPGKIIYAQSYAGDVKRPAEPATEKSRVNLNQPKKNIPKKE